MDLQPAKPTPPARSNSLWQDMSWQATFAGFLAAIAGFLSSFVVVIEGLRGAGASPVEAASGLLAAGMAMGLLSIILSLWTRLPIAIAWSTPGAALLATSTVLPGGFAEAVGAFLFSAVLMVIAGLWKPFGRAVERLPAPLANAMLAGVLFGLCLAPVKAIVDLPVHGLAIFATWLIIGQFNRLAAVPAALAVTLIIVASLSSSADVGGANSGLSIWPLPVFITPEFSIGGIIGISLPLFIVTMASQNIPGLAVLKASGYTTRSGPLIAATGVFSGLAAFFGGHAVNMAAITAAMMTREEAHPDPARRYCAAAVSGLFYVAFSLLAGLAALFIASSPPVLIQAVAGLALIGAFSGAAQAALNDPDAREAAAITFLVTASGMSVFGIGGAFWGLLAGGLVYALNARRKTRKSGSKAAGK